MSTNATYVVAGMTCGHCVNAVRAEVAKLQGVTTVAVDLNSGEVSVSSQHALDQVAVAAAVEEAGYEMVT